jgi:hypothetical protein
MKKIKESVLETLADLAWNALTEQEKRSLDRVDWTQGFFKGYEVAKEVRRES